MKQARTCNKKNAAALHAFSRVRETKETKEKERIGEVIGIAGRFAKFFSRKLTYLFFE